MSYSWTSATADPATHRSINHSFTVTGGVPTTYNVLLTVTDSTGKTGSITKPITINP